MDVIVEGGAVPVLVKHLQAPPYGDGDEAQKPFEHEVEKRSAFALAFLAIKVFDSYSLLVLILVGSSCLCVISCFGIDWLQPEHQQLIVDNGALTHLVNLLKRNKNGSSSRGVIRRAAEAIINLAHENSSIKSRVRSAYFKWFPPFKFWHLLQPLS